MNELLSTRWINEWTTEYKDEEMNELLSTRWINEWTTKYKDEKINELLSTRMKKWMIYWVHGWINEW